MSDYNLVNDDCLEILPEIPDNSIDMVLADLPYGTTACSWDSIIPLEPLWEQYERLLKESCSVVLTSAEPFTSTLIQSNLGVFKYKWVWKFNRHANFAQAPYMPLKKTEDVVVFSKAGIAENSSPRMKYNPQGTQNTHKVCLGKKSNEHRPNRADQDDYIQDTTNYPENVIQFDKPSNPNHPTQKPVGLFEYLIKTYTNEGDLVLDNVMGSGTAGVACQKTNRRFLGIEQDEEYFEIAQERIEEAKNTDWERVEGIEEWQQFDGIGKKTATTLYDELGSVDKAKMDELESIDGIGQKTAKSIREECVRSS